MKRPDFEDCGSSQRQPRLTKSEQMARVRTSDTAAEVLLRKRLWREGLRYALRRRLTGRPDIVFVSARLVVFVDGCFWHGCPAHYTTPKTNDDFWRRKLLQNRERDARVDAKLKSEGWTVVRVWEHEVEKAIDRTVARISESVRSARRPQGGLPRSFESRLEKSHLSRVD